MSAARLPAATVKAERERLIRERGNRCEVCGRPPKTRALAVDHDHLTGQVRGLLCFTDNRLLLGRGITAKRLRAAADYLDRYGPPEPPEACTCVYCGTQTSGADVCSAHADLLGAEPL